MFSFKLSVLDLFFARYTYFHHAIMKRDVCSKSEADNYSTEYGKISQCGLLQETGLWGFEEIPIFRDD